MPTFHVFNELLRPLGETLQADPIFEQVKTIMYWRDRDEPVPADIMPAIVYFLIPPLQDENRGSGSASIQTRKKTIRIGFGIFVYDAKDGARLDETLFQISADLEDWLYDHRDDFKRAEGIFIKDINTLDIDYTGGENGLVGSQMLGTDWEYFSAPGR